MNDATPKPKLTVTRWVFAVTGILIMLFTGGCTAYAVLMLTGDELGESLVSSIGYVLPYGLIPFLAGLLIWWLAVKSGR
ncbi:MAG: hypothetical protein AAF441_08265 [Pseudomonadota bacterium]